MAGLYFEQFDVGQRFEHLVRRTVTETDNLLFSALTMNPAAIHLDAEYSKGTPFGERIVNSVFTLGLLVGLSVYDTTYGTTIGNLGWEEVRFPRPVLIGDTLHAATTVLSKRESQSRPESRHRGVRAPCLESARRGGGFLPPRGADAEEAGGMSASGAPPRRAPARGGRCRRALRSWLFVPGDSERKQREGARHATRTPSSSTWRTRSPRRELPRRARARRAAAAARGRASRGRSCGCGSMRPRAACCTRTSPRSAPRGALPDGVVVPKVSAADEITEVAQYLATLETGFGRAAGSTRLLVIATETPRDCWRCRSTRLRSAARRDAARLAGLTWGAEDLGTALGALGAPRGERRADLHVPARAQQLPAGRGGARGAGHRRRAHRLPRCRRAAARARERAPRRLQRQARHSSRADRRHQCRVHADRGRVRAGAPGRGGVRRRARGWRGEPRRTHDRPAASAAGAARCCRPPARRRGEA